MQIASDEIHQSLISLQTLAPIIRSVPYFPFRSLGDQTGVAEGRFCTNETILKDSLVGT